METILNILRSKKSTKISRRWLMKFIADFEFGDSGYRVKDFILPNGNINILKAKEVYGWKY